jgi:crotonobetainyl-CoA:carnitine CoA-transferase CaiB-like acyl-CoA transferase
MRPLDGVILLEASSAACPLALRLAISMAGRIAADLGADVVKLEDGDGDPVRRIPPFVGGSSALFAFLNAGKRSIAVSARDRYVIARLIATADAVILDDVLHQAQATACDPRIAAVLSMFSPCAPPGIPASEFTVLALGGLLDLIGDPEREPLRVGGHQAAYAAGLAAYTGIAAALCRDENGGVAPEVVEVSLLDTVIWLNWKSAAIAVLGRPAPSRLGRISAWPVVRCLDGWIAVVYADTDWPVLRDFIGDPRLADPRFATREGRGRHADDLSCIVERAFGHLSRRAIQALAVARRLPLGPVLSPQELATDPQILARGFLHRVQLSDGAEAAMPRLPVLWSGRSFPPGQAPALPVGPGNVG